MEPGQEHHLIYRHYKDETTLEYRVFEPTKQGTTLVRLTGISAENAHEALLNVVGRKMYGLTLSHSGSRDRGYQIRLDVAPIVLAYIILCRRSRSPTKWKRMLEQLAGGELRSFQRWFTNFSDLAIELSRAIGDDRTRPFSPRALDAVSAGMKTTTEKLLSDKLRR